VTAWRASQSILAIKAEVDHAHPHRNKDSDGIKGDAAHAARTSDHNPDANGIVHAWDCTKDLSVGLAQSLVDFLVWGRDVRLKYIIWQGRIYSRRFGIWAWRPYTGPNRHDHHAHLSVYGDDGRMWGYAAWLRGTIAGWRDVPFPGTVRVGETSARVQQLAYMLALAGERGFVFKGKSGEVYGIGKQRAVKRFQKSHGLVADGIPGPATWAALNHQVAARAAAKKG